MAITDSRGWVGGGFLFGCFFGFFLVVVVVFFFGGVLCFSF